MFDRYKFVSKNGNLIFMLIPFLLAITFRLPWLDTPSMWFDEGASLFYAQNYTMAEMVIKHPTNIHPPLYYILLRLWLILGDSDYWVRLLSVIAGCASILVAFEIGRGLINRNFGFLFAMTLAFNTFHNHYSREVRMYVFLVFFILLGIYAFLKFAKYNRWFYISLFIVSGVCLLYLHGGGPVYFLSLYIGLLLLSLHSERYRNTRTFLLIGFIVSVFVYLPYWTTQLQAHTSVAEGYWVKNTSLRILFASIPLKTFLGVKLAPGSVWIFSWILPKIDISWTEWSYYMDGAAIFFVVYMLSPFAMFLMFKRHPSLFFIVLIGIFPILLFLAYSLLIEPILITRSAIPLVISASMIFSYLIYSALEKRRPLYISSAMVLILMLILSSFHYLSVGAVSKEEYKKSVKYLSETMYHNEPLVLNTGVGGYSLVSRYWPDEVPFPVLWPKEYPELLQRSQKPLSIEALRMFINTQNCKEFWKLKSHSWRIFPQGVDRYFKVIEKKKFRGISLVKYSCSAGALTY
ncbi:MAG: glycosyltransferase family 39 protein [Planctomycetota bacterium]|jgi:4-amino-4-deoxy-L-arabinose transferase-like glycosyltransferase